MARSLGAAYTAMVGDRTIRPTCRVYVYYGEGPTELEITSYVQEVTCTYSFDHEAGRADISVVNDRGIFDPVGGSLAAALAENNKVVIKAGLGNEVFSIFTGRLASGSVDYGPLPSSILRVTAYDMGKTLWEKRITSDVFEAAEVNDILTAILTDECGVAPDNINLAPQSYEVEQIQFVDEVAMDVGLMLMQPNDYRLYWDYDGNIVSKANAAPGTSSWDYDGRHVMRESYEWDDPAANKVVVLGRNGETTESLGEEVLFGYMLGDILRHGRTLNGIHWADVTGGQVYRECRLAKNTDPAVGKGDSHSDAWWTAVFADHAEPWTDEEEYSETVKTAGDGIAPGVRWLCPGSDDHYLQASVYGKPITSTTPRVNGSDEDTDLIAQYGEVLLEIDNPVIQTDEDAATVAAAVLARIKNSRYRPTITVLQNLTHEPGDRITYVSKLTRAVVAAQVERVTHRIVLGQEASTTLELIKL